MKIALSPVFSEEKLSVFRNGESLTVEGEVFDLSSLPDGATLPPGSVGCDWVIGSVDRIENLLNITLLLPHSADAPEAVRFPSDIVDPADGPVRLPGLQATAPQPSTAGAIDWSQMITAEQKAKAAAEQLLAQVAAETARLRATADSAIAPLQDAVDLDEATPAEAALLKDWKRYRVALNRLPDQPGYPAEIDWPAPPA